MAKDKFPIKCFRIEAKVYPCLTDKLCRLRDKYMASARHSVTYRHWSAKLMRNWTDPFTNAPRTQHVGYESWFYLEIKRID